MYKYVDAFCLLVVPSESESHLMLSIANALNRIIQRLNWQAVTYFTTYLGTYCLTWFHIKSSIKFRYFNLPFGHLSPQMVS